MAPLPYPAEAVLAATGTDKKHAGGRLRWVLPTADGPWSATTSRTSSSRTRSRACWRASPRWPHERRAVHGNGKPPQPTPTEAERLDAAAELARIRDRIDELDREIVERLNERADAGP